MQKLAMYSDKARQNSTQVLVEQYAPIVKRIAHHLLARLPAKVQLQDLIQSGMVGLLEAAKKYDATKGASFETYASIRIRGAMLDDLRKDDWAPRSVHRNARRISEAMKAIESRTGRDANDAEVAQELGITMEEYHAYLKDTSSTRLFSLEDLQEGGDLALQTGHEDTQSPLEEVQQEAFKLGLAQAINTLPERERLVLALYYREELNLKEIGAILGVSESRVSQIHSQAALRLRAKLIDWQE